MDHITDAMEMVEHLTHPAFCVREGIVVKVNQAAANRMLEPGTSVSALLKTGADEYAEFSEGCLYLTLRLAGQDLGFSVTRKNGFDLFHLEQDAENAELQAMALAARELREPLASIMITADHLFPAVDESSNPDTIAHMARINRGLFQMLRLISNMSDAGRYASGSLSLEIRNVTVLLDEIFAKASDLVERSGLTLDYVGLSEPIYSVCNPELLERAILNILSNALKFTPQGGCIRASLSHRGAKLYLSIADNGSGIGDATRCNLFSRYAREPGVEDGRFGIGLGFVMIRSAAQLHGGTVLVDQPQNTGTRVTMTLAIRPGSGDQVRSPLLKVDYAGERDHGLLELSDVLAAEFYTPQ